MRDEETSWRRMGNERQTAENVHGGPEDHA